MAGLMSRVSEDEVLLLWRALRAFRSGARPGCAPRRGASESNCPLYGCCPRWHGQPDDRAATLAETAAQTERRQGAWPCSKLLGLLGPDVARISP
jgi:hypothetical protein